MFREDAAHSSHGVWSHKNTRHRPVRQMAKFVIGAQNECSHVLSFWTHVGLSEVGRMVRLERESGARAFFSAVHMGKFSLECKPEWACRVTWVDQEYRYAFNSPRLKSEAGA